MNKRTMQWIKQKQVEGKHVSIVTFAETLMNPGGVQPMARAVQGVVIITHFD